MNAANQPSIWSIFIMVGTLFLVMYLFTVRPEKKRNDELTNLRNSIQLGDEIMTIGGIFGVVVRIKDDRITIASGAEKTKIEITKRAVDSILNRDYKTDSKTEENAAGDTSEKVSPKKIKKLNKKEESSEETPKED